MIENTRHHTSDDGTAVPGERAALWDRLNHVSWGAILLGLVIAIAVQILLGLLGIGLGFAILDPSDPMGGVGAWGIATFIYIIVSQIIALFIGGYTASRVSPAHTGQSAMLHGASIWALATIFMVWMGTTTAGMAVSGVSGAVSGIASVSTQAVKAVVPDDLPSISIPDIEFQDLPQPIQQTLRQNGVTPQNFQQEMRSAFRQVVSEQEQQRVMEELRQTLQEIVQNPAGAPEDIDQAVDDIFGQGGILTQEDVTELENTLQQRLNLSEQDVQEIVSQVQQTVDQARQGISQAIQTAKEQAVQTAEAVTGQIATIAFWLFIANLLGLIAAVFGGKTGETRVRV